MAGQSLPISPDPGVVHHNTVIDPVGRIVDFFRAVGINHTYFIAVSNKRLSLFIYPNGSFKSTMHRVAPKQADTLDEIIGCTTFSHNHGTQSKAITAVSLCDENAGHQATNPAKPIKHHIHRPIDWPMLGIDKEIQLPIDVLLQRQPLSLCFTEVLHRKATYVNVAGAQRQALHDIEDRRGLEF